MSNIETGVERMPLVLSHLVFVAGQSGRLKTIAISLVIAGDSFERYDIDALRLPPFLRARQIYNNGNKFNFDDDHTH